MAGFSHFKPKEMKPFSIHTAHDTLLGRTDIPLSSLSLPLSSSTTSSSSQSLASSASSASTLSSQATKNNIPHELRSIGCNTETRSNMDEVIQVEEEDLNKDRNLKYHEKKGDEQDGKTKDLPCPLMNKKEMTYAWEMIHSSILRLIDLGYDRSMNFSILPYIEKRLFDRSLHYAYERYRKRITDSWSCTEPQEVVQLCHQFVHYYDKLFQHFHHINN